LRRAQRSALAGARDRARHKVLVRFLTGDDPEQSPIAAAFLARLTPEAPGYLCREVILEMVWVLERSYRRSRAEVASAVEALLGAPELVVETDDDISVAVGAYADRRAGFADLMVAAAARRAGATALVTFDRKAATLAGVELLGS
jgi:predicted nucleic-acid-binding protein